MKQKKNTKKTVTKKRAASGKKRVKRSVKKRPEVEQNKYLQMLHQYREKITERVLPAIKPFIEKSDRYLSRLENEANKRLNLPFRINYRYVLILIGFLFFFGIKGLFFSRHETLDRSDLMPSMKIVEVEKRKISHTIKTPGTVTYKEKASVTSKILGRVALLNADVGKKISQGEVLAELESFELKIKRDQALAALNSARANLEQAKARHEDSRKGAEKQLKGLDRMQSDIIEAKSAYLLARKNLENKKQLYQMGGISEQELQKVYGEYLSSTSRYYQARKQLQIASVGYRDQDIGKIPDSINKEEAFIRSNTKIEKSGIGVATAAYQNAALDLKTAELYLQEAKIKSPIDGIVASRNIEVGEEVKQGEPLFTVVKSDQLLITTNISESDIHAIREGQVVQFTVDALDGKTMEGTIQQISPVLDIKSRTAEIKISADNTEGLLNPGMFVRCSIFIREKENGIALPLNAFVDQKEAKAKGLHKREIFVVKDGIAFKKEVTTGDSYGEELEVIDGLNEGEQVALGNLRLLKDGSPIKVETEEKEESGTESDAMRDENPDR